MWKTASSYISKRITPKRFDILVWTIILWIIWLNKSDLPDFGEIQVGIPPSINFDFSEIIKPFFYKFIFAFLFSVCANISLHIYVKNHTGFPTTKDPDEIKTLLKLLDERAGIKIIYESKMGTPAIRQSYSIAMMNELTHTRSLKILSIAGYESLGKGEGKSLFYDFLRREHIDIEYILLNPDSTKTIEERIKQLKKSYPEYNIKSLIQEINTTVEKLRTLKIASSGTVVGYYCKFHPIFRLFIFDRCLFMSTYEVDRHGHESPVYKIDKIIDIDSTNLSLYDTFLNFFDKIKNNSKPISLGKQK